VRIVELSTSFLFSYFDLLWPYSLVKEDYMTATDNATLRRSAKSPRPEKTALVDEIKELFSQSQAAVFTEYRGLTVAQLAELRAELRNSGTEYKVYKNTLVRRAANDSGYELDDILTGPVAVAFAKNDAAAAAKSLKTFSDANEALILKGGVLGASVMSADDIKALAKLPSREVLLSQIAGTFQSPMVKSAGLFQAFTRNAAYAFKALADKKQQDEAA
jgi:large subunit ribosomal protein L10